MGKEIDDTQAKVSFPYGWRKGDTCVIITNKAKKSTSEYIVESYDGVYFGVRSHTGLAPGALVVDHILEKAFLGKKTAQRLYVTLDAPFRDMEVLCQFFFLQDFTVGKLRVYLEQTLRFCGRHIHKLLRVDISM